jgi:HSP20 family protein
LSLGDGIDADRIAATYENGVLTVTIPMAEKAKPRRIQIDTRTERTVIDGSAESHQIAGT